MNNNSISPNVSPTDEEHTNIAATPTHSQMLRFQQTQLSNLSNIQVPSAEQLIQYTDRPIKRINPSTLEHEDQKRMKSN